MCKVSLTASAQHMQTSRNPSGEVGVRSREYGVRSSESGVRSPLSGVPSPGHWAHCGCSRSDFPVSFRWEPTGPATANIFWGI